VETPHDKTRLANLRGRQQLPFIPSQLLHQSTFAQGKSRLTINQENPHMGISIWLYIHQITVLEHDFRSLRNSIAALRRKLAEGATDENRVAIKLELDLIIGHVRILKEQTVCFNKIGEQFDLAALLKETLLFLHALDPAICMNAINQLNLFIENSDTGNERSS
jgi:hypothetical protein